LEHFEGTLIIDADGLNALAENRREDPAALRRARGRVLLTPHPGEFARLTGRSIPEIQADSLSLAENFARTEGVTLLLKGPATIITDGTETWLTDRGCPGMATAGSGDVLSGILAALCAWLPEELLRATVAAAWINGRAGELAQEESSDISMTASDTVRALPAVFRLLRNPMGK
jgi:NAD(P)H-hydrate epimerase